MPASKSAAPDPAQLKEKLYKGTTAELSFAGGDNRGHVYDAGDDIQRLCYGSDDYPADIFKAYQELDLISHGVVQTTYSPETRTFTHAKHVISYPHEWPPSLFKDVVLFHLDLLIHLGKHGLTLKDALPENVLLEGVRPVLVDFFSLIREEHLGEEAWLMSGVPHDMDPRLRVLQLMFVPYMLLPLLLYAGRDFCGGRRVLAERFCNNASGVVATWGDVPQLSLAGVLVEVGRVLSGKSSFTRLSLIRRLRSLCTDPEIDWEDRLSHLRMAVTKLDVEPGPSSYSSYYDDKGESYGFTEKEKWGEKQRSIHDLLVSERPVTVLDLGANTGWFSRLACSGGASVIAADIDLSSIDQLYREARSNRLPLTPLWLSFDDLVLEHHSMNITGERHEIPFHMAATKRLKSDLVLCLGLLHHLVLGCGKSLHEIFSVLSELTRSVLVLEYVALEDELIAAEPGFFKMLEKNMDEYSKEKVLAEGLKHFRTFRISASHPDTRQLLLFHKK